MKIHAIERHAYAPELNRVYIRTGGGFVECRAPGVRTTQEWRAKFKPHAAPMIWATVSTEYADARFSHLNRTYSGRVDARRDALKFAASVRAKNCGGILFDGSVMPPARVTVKTRLIG